MCTDIFGGLFSFNIALINPYLFGMAIQGWGGNVQRVEDPPPVITGMRAKCPAFRSLNLQYPGWQADT